MTTDIAGFISPRGITRLCHFTPSRNLVHIASGKTGILATGRLERTERAVFSKTDLLRLDGHKNHVCCSIQYPNAWYFEKARAKEVIFKDWVVLLLSPNYLADSETGFCQRNAAASGGAGVSTGLSAFKSLYNPTVTGAYGKSFVRDQNRLTSCPTDDQAEILVKDCIPKNDILFVGVASKSQAKSEIARLRIAEILHDFRFLVAPDFYNARRLSSLIQTGKIPEEIEYRPE